jgi:hypothetical protein
MKNLRKARRCAECFPSLEGQGWVHMYNRILNPTAIKLAQVTQTEANGHSFTFLSLSSLKTNHSIHNFKMSLLYGALRKIMIDVFLPTFRSSGATK